MATERESLAGSVGLSVERLAVASGDNSRVDTRRRLPEALGLLSV